MDNLALQVLAQVRKAVVGKDEVISKAIEDAVEESKKLGIHGKETTPFLLAKIKDITGGDSLASNIQLVYNNARLAAKTACELVALAKN